MRTLKLGKQIEDKLDIMEKKILGTIESSGKKDEPSQQLEKITSMRETVVAKMAEQQTEVDKTLKRTIPPYSKLSFIPKLYVKRY